MPLADFIPSGSDAGFLSRHTLIRTGSVLVGAGSDTGNMAVIDGELALSTVFLPLLGQISFQVGNRRLEARQGQSLVFLAGEAFRSENGFYAGSCFSVPLGRLAAQAAELSGDPGSIDRFLTGCRESRQINLAPPPAVSSAGIDGANPRAPRLPAAGGRGPERAGGGGDREPVDPVPHPSAPPAAGR